MKLEKNDKIIVEIEGIQVIATFLKFEVKEDKEKNRVKSLQVAFEDNQLSKINKIINTNVAFINQAEFKKNLGKMKQEEAIRELNFLQKQARFENFTYELEKLSKKYGVLIETTGGVNVLSEKYFKSLKEVFYSNDSSSGDLSYDNSFKTSKKNKTPNKNI